ncbi:MAG: hypothetical protein ACRYG2_21865 [Janthinobacterium lividum]
MAGAVSEIDLAVPTLERLHARRSMKWDGAAPDVLAATVAEIESPVLPAVVQPCTS